MHRLHFGAAYTLGILCTLGPFLVGCQQQVSGSVPLSSPPPVTVQAQPTVNTSPPELGTESPDTEWEQISLALPESCSNHVFSPDWKWVACRDQPSIWVAPIAHGRIGTSSLVASDGPAMIFSLSGFPPGRSGFVLIGWDYSSELYTSTLWLVEPSDPSQRILLHRDSLPVSPQWSPDGRHLIVADGKGWAKLLRNFGTNSQSVVPIDHQLGPGVKVAWSPLGDQVFYCGQTKVSGIWKLGGWILDVDSLDATLLFTTIEPFEPSWSPDGELLAALSPREVGEDDWEIRFLRPTGVPLTTVELPGLQQAYRMIWSPDAKRLAMEVSQVGEADIEIGLIDVSSEQFSLIITADVRKLIGWTNDGRAVIILRDSVVTKVPVAS